jgi:hypothetical protein
MADHSLSGIARVSVPLNSSGNGNRGSSALVFVFLVAFKGAVIVKDDALRFGRAWIWGRRERREEGAIERFEWDERVMLWSQDYRFSLKPKKSDHLFFF